MTPPPHIPEGMSLVGTATLEAHYKALTNKTWCVVEHSTFDTETQRPVVIFITACKLSEVYTLAYARGNSEWLRRVTDTTYLYIRILLIGEKTASMREASRRIRSASPMPICNMKGYDTRGLSRIICCSNGQEYPTQLAAAQALGIAQSQISNHMNGHATHARGLVFWFKE